MVWYGIAPDVGAAGAARCFLVLAAVIALGVGLWLAALNVRYRDVSYTVAVPRPGLAVRSPVVYPVTLVPEPWRLVYSLNPMAGVIEGFRWALLGHGGARPARDRRSARSWPGVLVGGLVSSGGSSAPSRT